MKLLHQIHLLSLALSLWKTLRWVSWFNFLDCWVRLGGFWGGFPGSTCWIAGFYLVGLLWGGFLGSTWWDLLGSEVGLLGSKVDFLVRLSSFWGGIARFAGFNLPEMGFSGFEIFFFGWLCCIFGLIWYFGALGFDDFATGVWKNSGFEIYDFIFELNFLSFFVFLFLKKIFGFAIVCLSRKNMKFMFRKRRNVLTKKKVKNK